jgi:NAD(P)-dependent dehydrogenase (short-subunit alcohol dehydrogenase family)
VNDICPGVIRMPISDKMEAEGQGAALKAKLQTFVPMKREGRPRKSPMPFSSCAAPPQATAPAGRIAVDGGFVRR